MENSELPFENGIYYTPTPPAKRMIYDLDQLSGGEKSIASLALQYSLAVCSKSPFLILDESDAYLDANNASKLLKLLGVASKGIFS
jgi:structural maintenance of chromosome 1